MSETRTEILPDAASGPVEFSGARPGQQIGKYVIRSTIGAGGCGTVYAAYDPILEREVALKLLARTRPTEGATVDPGWPRLVREARMLARLSEPQVVTVYDVGDEAGQAFLAMQMVEGGDLKGWIERHRGATAAQPRGLDDALALLEQAGRGLAVAHEAGVVHGDFKPANVLIDARGRAKVSDFGIARLAAASADEVDSTHDARRVAPTQDTGRSGGAMDRSARTFTTSVGRPIVGTPAYMAPEQFGGQAADVVSDVYTFCATLYHAVYAQLPFRGATIAEIAARKAGGELVLPATPVVPAWLSKLLTGGLSAERSERPQTMASVLEVFERARGRPRRRWFLVGGALGGAAVVAGIMAWRAPSEMLRCRDAAGGDFPWSDDVRTRVTADLEAASTIAVPLVLGRVTEGMDAFAGQWRQTYDAACSAAWPEPRLADQAFACLRRRRSMVAALVEAWHEPGPNPIDGAMTAVSALPSVVACVDPEALAGQPDLPLDDALREQVIETHEHVDASVATARTQQHNEALGMAQSAYERATKLGYEPLVAQAALAYGQALEISGDNEAARAKLREAFFGAQRWDDYETAAAAAERLVFLVGTRLDEYEEGLLWVEHARVALAKTGGSTAVLSANEGSILDRLGRHDEALVRYQEALAAHDPADAYGQGVTLLRMGDALRSRGRGEEALAHYDRARAKWVQALGADHPRLAVIEQSRATALSKLGRNDEAIVEYQRAIEGLTRLMGPDNANVGAAYVNLGLSLKYTERFAEAEAAMREALRVTIVGHGEQHIRVANRREALGRLLTLMGRGAEAVVEHTKARAEYQRSLPEDHPDRVMVQMNLGDAHQAEGADETAIAEYRLGVEIASRSPDNAELKGDALAYLGRGLVRAGRAAQARDPLEQAIALLKDSQEFADARAMAQEWLTKATDGERPH